MEKVGQDCGNIYPSIDFVLLLFYKMFTQIVPAENLIESTFSFTFTFL